MAFWAICSLAVMPSSPTKAAAPATPCSSLIKVMESPYRSRKASTVSGCSSMNWVRPTTQPMAREPWPSLSHSSDRDRAWRTPSSFIIRAVAAGTGSIQMALSLEAIWAVTSWAVIHWMSTWLGSTPFWVSR